MSLSRTRPLVVTGDVISNTIIEQVLDNVGMSGVAFRTVPPVGGFLVVALTEVNNRQFELQKMIQSQFGAVLGATCNSIETVFSVWCDRPSSCQIKFGSSSFCGIE